MFVFFVCVMGFFSFLCQVCWVVLRFRLMSLGLRLRVCLSVWMMILKG